MKNLTFPITLIGILFFLFSCSNHDNKEAVQQVFTNWRYFGESDPGDSAKIFSAGIISTYKDERDMAMSPEGKEIFYSVVLPGSNLSVIVRLYHDGAFWSGIQTAPFSGAYSDLEPAFTPDGKQLFFISKRPVSPDDETDDWNIWFVDQTDRGWSEPKVLGSPVNTDGDEFYPSISSNGNLYFTSIRDDSFGAEDIYLCKPENGSWSEPINLGEGVNSELYEFNAYIAPDESYLLFGSYGRDDDLGGGDLYISFRENDTTWSPAKNLGPGINSNKLDYCPFVPPVGNYLFFTSQRINPEITDEHKKSIQDINRLNDGIENGLGNIFWVAFDPDKWK